MAVNIDSKFDRKLTCDFKNDMKNLANFHRLKISNFTLESKMVELNKNQNSKLFQISKNERLFHVL